MSYKKTVIGLIPDTWDICDISEVSKVIDSLHQTPTYSDNGIPMVRVTDIKEDGLCLKNCYKVSDEVYKLFTKNHVPKSGDILISRVGTYGVFSYVKSKDRFCLGQNTAIISPKINCRFLFYNLINDKTKQQIDNFAVGSTQKTISLKNIKTIKIPVCSEAEQKAIADTLSYLDDKIELNNRINKNLEKMAQAIFKSWFVDFEPFQEGEFEDSELGRIPKGWRVVEFSKMSTVQNGYAFKSSDYQADGCKMIRTTNIGTDGFVDNIDLINLPYNFLTDAKYENFRFELFDTVLVMVGASVGKIGLITEKNIPSLQNQNMWRFRPILKNVSPIYIHYTVKLINDRVKNWSSGSARDFYRKDSFQRAKCLFPSEEVLKKFTQLVESIFSLISLNLMKNENLKDIRDTILPKLMSGEIRVPIEEVQ